MSPEAQRAVANVVTAVALLVVLCVIGAARW